METNDDIPRCTCGGSYPNFVISGEMEDINCHDTWLLTGYPIPLAPGTRITIGDMTYEVTDESPEDVIGGEREGTVCRLVGDQ